MIFILLNFLFGCTFGTAPAEERPEFPLAGNDRPADQPTNTLELEFYSSGFL